MPPLPLADAVERFVNATLDAPGRHSFPSPIPSWRGVVVSTSPQLTLAPQHTQMLAASAITPAIIAERGYVSIAPGSIHDWRQVAGSIHSDNLLRSILHAGALAFPVYRLGDAVPYTWVLRPDLPRSNDSGKPVKYEYPKLTANIFDVLPRYAAALANPAIPIWITEGAKKADALASLYDMAIVPISENGVFGWRSRNAQGGKTAIVDMELIAWEGRQIVIAPDGDVRFNKGVQQAVQRLARLLIARYGAAEVLVLHLPNAANGPKLGVDDFLAQGHSAAELEALLTTLGTVTASACVPLLTHPDTGEKLFLPPGYDVSARTIIQRDGRGNERSIYSGNIFVRELGIDMMSGEQTATISWNGRGSVHGERTIPYAALSDSKTFSSLVGAAGAAIHPRNIKDVQALLVESVQANIDTIPRRQHSERLGLVHGGLILPAGAVGFADPVRYTGHPSVAIGDDPQIYPAAIRTAIQTWPDAWPFWLALGLSLAAPALAKMRPRRYPVLYMSGDSGSGKTTVLQFALGCWGAPTRQPLRMEAGRTTPAGIFQGLEQLGGLPLFIDEAHTCPDTKRIENAAYAFANGQRYTVGGADGKTHGGGELGGALLLAGEAIPDFKHAGARLRVLWADANSYAPLGALPRSDAGEARALLLEQAWETGAGLFGHAVAERIWRDWAAFVNAVRASEADAALAPIQAWRTPLAAAAVALHVALQCIEAPPPQAFGTMLTHWTEMLTSGHDETDPATDAWEAMITMLAQGRRNDDGDSDHQGQRIPDSATWEWIEADQGGGLIACRKVSEEFWRVLSSSPQFKERVGPAAVQLYGQTWLRREWLLPGRDGKATEPMKTHTNTLLRMLKVPTAALHAWKVTP